MAFLCPDGTDLQRYFRLKQIQVSGFSDAYREGPIQAPGTASPRLVPFVGNIETEFQGFPLQDSVFSRNAEKA